MALSRGAKITAAMAAVITAAVLIIRVSMSGVDPAHQASFRREGGVPVLAYHFFNDRGFAERGLRAAGTVLLNLPLITTKDAWSIHRGAFEKQIEYLYANGYRAITLEELESYMRGETDIGDKCVVITFDDGDRSVYQYAYPLLERYGMRGTLFMITSKAGMEWNNLEISSWKELREMEESGVIDIQSHTHDMHYKVLKGDSPHPVFEVSRENAGEEKIKNISDDLGRSRFALEYYLGKRSRFLAWPYGFGSPLSDSLAVANGFDAILTLRKGLNRPGDSVLRMKRYPITPRTSFDEFKRIVNGSSG